MKNEHSWTLHKYATTFAPSVVNLLADPTIIVRFNVNKDQHWQWNQQQKNLIFKILEKSLNLKKGPINDVNGIHNFGQIPDMQPMTKVFRHHTGPMVFMRALQSDPVSASLRDGNGDYGIAIQMKYDTDGDDDWFDVLID